MRNTFWPAERSRARRSSSATRSTNAEAGTTSPYTNGFCVTSNTVMTTDYSVMARSVAGAVVLVVGRPGDRQEHRIERRRLKRELEDPVRSHLGHAVGGGAAELIERRSPGTDDDLRDAAGVVAAPVGALGSEPLVEMVVAVHDEVGARVEKHLPR